MSECQKQQFHTTHDPVELIDGIQIDGARKITGISAILLPFLENHGIDWDGFDVHVTRTVEAGLAPAVNMDTGYVNLIDEKTRAEVLRRTQDLVAGRMFVAGAFIGDRRGDQWDLDAYRRQIDAVEDCGGTPIIFQSFGLTEQSDEEIVEAYQTLARYCISFIGFELGTMFAPFGKIYGLDTYAKIMTIPECLGAKHSSLDRQLEWQRLNLRNDIRPEFKVFTGNDLAIDMVKYGSDYLLGLSTFAPDAFALRDTYWENGDLRFYELNDLLQYLGFFAFRHPVPGYKHTAAQFLKLRGWISSDCPHSKAERRPQSDVAILGDILERLEAWLV
jgi:dihydrodipicolinate synthase/N-acetylneuraminate lyase